MMGIFDVIEGGGTDDTGDHRIDDVDTILDGTIFLIVTISNIGRLFRSQWTPLWIDVV